MAAIRRQEQLFVSSRHLFEFLFVKEIAARCWLLNFCSMRIPALMSFVMISSSSSRGFLHIRSRILSVHILRFGLVRVMSEIDRIKVANSADAGLRFQFV
jgi:hypothetical protein